MSWLAFLLLSLAAWRSWALLARDLILDRIRDRVAPLSTQRRDWLECPYCSGFWTAGGWVTFWNFAHGGSWAWWAVGWWAVACMVVLIEATLDAVTGK